MLAKFRGEKKKTQQIFSLFLISQTNCGTYSNHLAEEFTSQEN